MKDFITALNTDGKLEVFYIDNHGNVQHMYQETTESKVIWSKPAPIGPLNGTNPTISNVVSLSASSNSKTKGKIQVLAQTQDGKYYLCYQEVNKYWQGWFLITQN